MFVKNIKIKNYKNLLDVEISTQKKINCLVGNNGAGKTNFLDAIYYLSNAKSYFNYIDNKNIKYNENYFFIEGNFENENNINNVSVSFSTDKGKVLKQNGKKLRKISEHYGHFPVVIITPYDTNLIIDGSEERRNFIDSIISQYDKEFLQNLINYKKILLQRNTLLRKFAETKTFDNEILDLFNYKLIQLNPAIHTVRQNFIQNFKPIFKKYYTEISKCNENIDIEYKSSLNNNNITELLAENLQKDRIMQRTTTGIHKDDILFTIDKNQLKKNASQGQQKNYLIALKFAQADFIKKYLKINPILLLDDIFDKLDPNRMKNVVELVADKRFGQIFITHTSTNKLQAILKPIKAQYDIHEVTNGKIKIKNPQIIA